MCYINAPMMPPHHPQAGGFSYCPHCGRSLWPANGYHGWPSVWSPICKADEEKPPETNDDLRARLLLEEARMKARAQGMARPQAGQ